MMVDGYEKTKIHEVLENEIEFEQEDLEQTVKFMKPWAATARPWGSWAVFGLIHAMGLLDAPDKRGAPSRWPLSPPSTGYRPPT